MTFWLEMLDLKKANIVRILLEDNTHFRIAKVSSTADSAQKTSYTYFTLRRVLHILYLR